ncbi:Putative exported protein [Aeromonas veronii B565]|nr:Putative exported protein [Aeromonas veronii B565]
MERCTAAEVDALAIKAFHQAVEGDRSFLDTLIKARATTLTPAQQAQLQQVGQAELDRLAGMKEFALPFSLTKYLKQL